MSTSRTIEIIFAGVDNLSSSLVTMGGNVEDFGQGLQDFGAPFADATEKILALQAALGAIAVGGLTLAVTKAGEFSAGMAEVNTLLGVSDTEFKALSDGLIEYSTGSTASMGDLQSALYNMISLGVDYGSSIETLSTIEKLSVGAKADMTTATETLIGTMNAYGAEIGEASNYSDAFFTIIKDGKTTLPELSTSIASVTGIASTANIPFETLGAAVAALTATGAPTSEAMTQIKAAITALVAPTDATTVAAKAYGVEIGQAALDADGFEGVLRNLYDATGGSLAKMQEIIPSIEGVSAAVILGADSAGTFVKAMEDMANNTGATEQAFEKMKDNLGLTWQTMTNNFDAMFLKLGLSLEGESSDLLKGFTALFKSIGDSLGKGDFDNIISAIKGFMSDITESVNAMAKNVPEALKGMDFKGLIESYESIKDELSKVFGDIDLTSVEGLKAAIGFVEEGLITLNSVTTGIVGIFTPLVEGVIDLTTWFNSLDEGSQKVVGQILGVGTALVTLGGVVSMGGSLLTGLGSLIGFMGPTSLLIVGSVAIAVGLGEFVESLVDLGEEVDFVTPRVEAMSGLLEGLPEDVKTELKLALETGDLEKFDELLNDVSEEDWEAKVQAEVDDAQLTPFVSSLDALPTKKEIEMMANYDPNDLSALNDAFDAVAEDRTVNVVAEADVSQAMGEISWFDDEGKEHVISIPVESSGVDDAKKEIEEIPTEKMLEIKLQGDIDKEIETIKSSAETVQTAMEWTAKIDIAEAVAMSEMMSSAFDAATDSVLATSTAASSMFGDLAGSISGMSMGDKWDMTSILEGQMDMEQQALDIQKELTAAQIEYMDAKTKSMKNGNGQIKIDGTGLSPALEMVMWEILELVQVKATSENADFLLGL